MDDMLIGKKKLTFRERVIRGESNIKIDARIDLELARKLLEATEKENTTISDIIRRALKNYLYKTDGS